MRSERFALAMLLPAVALLGACGSRATETPNSVAVSETTGTAQPSAKQSAPVTVSTVAGTKACGAVNLLSGWPTTMAPSPNSFDCIVAAAASGTPAQMTVTSAGDGSSGRKTTDGYDIPTHRVVTYVVRGPGEIVQAIDQTEDGGGTTVFLCSGLTAAVFGEPSPTGCKPG